MPWVLEAAAGDPDALKVGIAATESRTSVSFSAKSAGTFRFSDSSCAAELTSANAAARLLGGSASPSAAVDAWVDWEEAVLCSSLPDASSREAACQHLEEELAAREFLGAEGFSVADIAVSASLLPWEQVLSPKLKAYLASVKARPSFGQASSLVGEIRPAEAHPTPPRGLPVAGQRNVLITSALPYVNNVPHLGNIIGCVLSADCYARYCRARGINTVYVCGTDEYGTATETKALEEGLTCQEICDKYHAQHKAIYEWFQISFDHFGRTPTWQQTEIAQSIFETLRQQGQLKEQTTQQLFSEAANTFLADRFVSGTCPNADCNFEDARGDQCDKCGRLMNPTELVHPRCKLTGTVPVLRNTSHYFLDLPGLTPQLQAYITSTSQSGAWTPNCVQVTNAWMRDGLKVRSITRDLRWGTPVPVQGYENKVFYVWFDAPIGYVSITANLTPDWKAWWQNPEEVELVQFMGKDNVPFHTVIFPATLLGTGQPWTLMKGISVTEYLTYEGAKFSKRNGVGIFGNDTQATGIPVEVWRYYLLSNRPETSDADFKWADFVAKNNAELLGNLGNFVNRTLRFAYDKFEGAVPKVHTSKGAEAVQQLQAALQPLIQQYREAMDRIKFKEGLRTCMAISSLGNKFFQDHELWVMVKTDSEQCGSLVAACVGLVLLLAATLQPFMPSFSSKVLEQMNMPEVLMTDAFLASASQLQGLLEPGHVLNKATPLVAKISPEQEAELRVQFSGTQASRTCKPAGLTKPQHDTKGSKAAKGRADSQPAKEKADKGRPADGHAAKGKDKAAKAARAQKAAAVSAAADAPAANGTMQSPNKADEADNTPAATPTSSGADQVPVVAA